jgi:hypothetical protein
LDRFLLFGLKVIAGAELESSNSTPSGGLLFSFVPFATFVFQKTTVRFLHQTFFGLVFHQKYILKTTTQVLEIRNFIPIP